jgi:Fur family transcriptional regulator, ferric uptake regulator
MNTSIIELLEKHQIRPTPMRMLVLEQLMVLNRHVTLLELETMLFPADRVTIYRTLQTFKKMGLSHTVDSPLHGTMYALCRDGCNLEVHKHNHPHFFCTKCQAVTCNTNYTAHIEKKESHLKYAIHSVEVSLIGLCPNCNV